jgi:predicted metal-binding membrane protein
MSLQRERTFILALLLILAAASWAVLIWQSSMMKSMGMGLTMGMGATLFLAIWVVMMIAMMFPATATMNLAFARVQRERHSSRRPSVSTWIFVGAYLLVWTLFGVLAYLGVGSTDPLDHAERGPDWWRHPGAGRALPAYTPQTGLPGKMLHASGFHPWWVA